ncbi:DUF294 nucleotidyltransferase-like domain-containing protein [Haliea sp. E1-2-M8]|uniref:DUF294 nucleotidyltransferase-like domain-containing protein n=1 Tax=Haliea sp. E1-2-M8 TaxID=3064706 RepID=UPI002716B332|nr:DUF294 nucleotidyltransferase-like domain-containing protein [Haliea sp. E1-2-M8]MDO8862553.1 DUF294 nucleotidyltransferase-like domain-containing protein [Haliea sp. E1-2-M8]
MNRRPEDQPDALRPLVDLAPVADFLRRTLPFQDLPAAELEQVLAALRISYHVHGSTLLADAPEQGLRILRSGAVDLRDRDNTLLDRLGEGESFHLGGLNAGGDEVRAIVIEDALLYLLPDAAYQRLRQRNRPFDRYFSSQRSRRLRRAARYQPAPNTLLQDLRGCMSTDLLTVTPGDSLQTVARAMTARRVSSALVLEGDRLQGIVTDRDLRTRCVAEALPVSTSIAAVMTPAPETIDADSTLFDATLQMTRRGYHHLPVTEDGRLTGMITSSDLILARQDDPVYLVQHISRQDGAEGIRDLLAGLPQLVLQWHQAGMRAQQVGRILTAITDAVTVRLIQLAEAELGPAPAAWCWTAFGSQGRAEQLLGADQDNGMILADDARPEHAPWFAALAHKVCDGLDLCGYPYCQGEVMATTDSWRQPLAQWRETVRRWTDTPTPAAVMRVSIFFDLRAVYGDAGLCAALQDEMLHRASRNSIFLAALAANALDRRPPLGIFRRFVIERDGEHRDAADLKKRGVMPLTDIVRLHALAHCVTAVNTEERLQTLASERHLTIGDSRNLADALHCIQQQRLQQQCQQVLRGAEPDNFLNPRGLPTMAREQLRDAFTIIDQAQAALRLTYRAGLD